ncbi:unnamed protein product [Ambrosiozyma monospora]|uniref:Unnamed protein product n=1 Tax=Ambrosiozyma monospora TaxID=43982 RepID=A0ACB5THS4_AMBMO|nr:unnamed protein product [Ambrosiozyma monospora]
MDNTNCSGWYGFETVFLGNKSIEINNVSIGVSDEATQNYGLLGLGYKTQTDTLTMSMVDQGLIHHNAYSVYLGSSNVFDNGHTSDEGSILFGAIDHANYIGSLTLLPIASPNDNVNVVLNTLSIANLTTGSNKTLATGHSPALFDTGTTHLVIPQEIYDALIDQIEVLEYDSDSSQLIGDCFELFTVGLTFDFMGLEMTFALGDFICSNGLSRDDGKCVLGIDGFDSDGFILGDTFLNHVYFAADLSNHQIALAYVNFKNGDADYEEDVELIESSIPSATSAKYYHQSSATASKLVVQTS